MPPDVHSQDVGSKETSDLPPDAESAAAAMRAVAARLAELRAYAVYYLAAKIDQVRLSIRQLVLAAVLCVLLLIAAAGVIVTAIVLLLEGVAGGVAAICGQRWLGDLICGVLFLGIIAIGVWSGLKRFSKMSRQMTVNKYESKQRQQRSEFGQDVGHRTGGSAGKQG
jgi:hypothetical protein